MSKNDWVHKRHWIVHEETTQQQRFILYILILTARLPIHDKPSFWATLAYVAHNRNYKELVGQFSPANSDKVVLYNELIETLVNIIEKKKQPKNWIRNCHWVIDRPINPRERMVLIMLAIQAGVHKAPDQYSWGNKTEYELDLYGEYVGYSYPYGQLQFQTEPTSLDIVKSYDDIIKELSKIIKRKSRYATKKLDNK